MFIFSLLLGFIQQFRSLGESKIVELFQLIICILAIFKRFVIHALESGYEAFSLLKHALGKPAIEYAIG